MLTDNLVNLHSSIDHSTILSQNLHENEKEENIKNLDLMHDKSSKKIKIDENITKFKDMFGKLKTQDYKTQNKLMSKANLINLQKNKKKIYTDEDEEKSPKANEKIILRRSSIEANSFGDFRKKLKDYIKNT